MEQNSFLSIRQLKRSQSTIVTQRNELDDSFGTGKYSDMCTNSSPKLSIYPKRVHPCDFHRSLEENTEYLPKKKQSFFRRHRLLLVLFIMTILGSSVALTYHFVVKDTGSHSVDEKKVDMNPLSQRQTEITFNSITETEKKTSGFSSKPVIEMNFDKVGSNDESDILKWKHAENVIGITAQLEYGHGYLILPQAGFYEIHVTLSIDVQYINVNDSLGLYICVSKFEEKEEDQFSPIRCVRTRVPYFWAGQLNIFISRMYFQQNEVLVTTISTDYMDKQLVKKIIRSDASESHLHMFNL